MAEPLITVAMPIYNAGKDLRLALLSVLAQSEADWELLLIDDGSTDHALDTVQDLLSDARITVVRDGQNKGLARRLNEAIDLAHGQYFARMDQDDVSFPQRFSMQLQALQQHSELDVVAVRAILIDEHNHEIGRFPAALAHAEICARPWRGFHFPHPTWMGKTAWFKKFKYGEPGPYLCEDQELLLRSYPHSRFATVDQVLFAYRVRAYVPLRKWWKTRLSVLKMQLRHFAQRRQVMYGVLALLVFAGRVLRDVSRELRYRWRGNGESRQAATQSAQWQSVYRQLAGSKPDTH